jgi:hypothetical protein
MFMTPIPLIFFLWGIAMVLDILPHRVWWIALPGTYAWDRARRILGCAAMLSCGLWLILGLTLPALMHSRQSAARLADAIGWGLLLVAAAPGG